MEEVIATRMKEHLRVTISSNMLLWSVRLTYMRSNLYNV